MDDLIAKLRSEANIYASLRVTTHELLTEAADALTTAQAEAGAQEQRIAELLERAATAGYIACAEDRHVTLGDKVRQAILALSEPMP